MENEIPKLAVGARVALRWANDQAAAVAIGEVIDPDGIDVMITDSARAGKFTGALPFIVGEVQRGLEEKDVLSDAEDLKTAEGAISILNERRENMRSSYVWPSREGSDDVPNDVPNDVAVAMSLEIQRVLNGSPAPESFQTASAMAHAASTFLEAMRADLFNRMGRPTTSAENLSRLAELQGLGDSDAP